MTDGKCVVCRIVGIIVVIGALNWGLVGFFQVDLVGQLLGPMTPAARAVYAVVGIAGVLKLLALFKCCPCQKGSCESKK